jgi:hypothetical protein
MSKSQPAVREPSTEEHEAARAAFERASQIIDPILPLAYAAYELGLCVRTLKRYHEDGELEIIRLSARRIGVRRSELTRFINKRAHRAVKVEAA